jgi:hypothetical protein
VLAAAHHRLLVGMHEERNRGPRAQRPRRRHANVVQIGENPAVRPARAVRPRKICRSWGAEHISFGHIAVTR